MDILVGILAVIIGVAACFAGLRFFLALLPVFAFVAGFFLGDGFLSTALGVVIGIVVGIGFSAISYLYWYFSVVISAGASAGVLAAALFSWFGVNWGWLLFLIGLAATIVVMVLAFVIAYPAYLVIFTTAIEGAILILGGIMLMFDEVDLEHFGTSVVWNRIEDRWFLWIVFVVLAAAGVGSQLRAIAAAVLPAQRWVSIQSAS